MIIEQLFVINNKLTFQAFLLITILLLSSCGSGSEVSSSLDTFDNCRFDSCQFSD